MQHLQRQQQVRVGHEIKEEPARSRYGGGDQQQVADADPFQDALGQEQERYLTQGGDKDGSAQEDVARGHLPVVDGEKRIVKTQGRMDRRAEDHEHDQVFVAKEFADGYPALARLVALHPG